MSTRANIIIKDGEDHLFFYRHSDGYPEGALPTLKIFMDWIKSGKVRDNISQAAGWLIMLGAIEYGTIPTYESANRDYPGQRGYGKMETIVPPADWKAGSIEPTTGIHGDIDNSNILIII